MSGFFVPRSMMEFDFEEILDWLKTKKKLLSGLTIIFGVFILSFSFIFNNQNKSKDYLNSKTIPKKVSSQKSETQDLIVVDVKGEVNKPNIYRVKKGTIMFDVIQKAGGTTPDADTSQLNLASQVTDGQMITVKNINDKNQVAVDGDTTGDNTKINLNTATIEQLKTVPGIGDSKASMIIKYREEKGNFKDVKELDNISGFGPKTIEKLKDYLTV